MSNYLLDELYITTYIIETNIPSLFLTEDTLDYAGSPRSQLCEIHMDKGTLIITPSRGNNQISISILIQGTIDSISITEEEKYKFTIRFSTEENDEYYLVLYENYDDSSDGKVELNYMIARIKAQRLYYQAEILLKNNPNDIHKILDQYLVKTKYQIFDHRLNIANFEDFIIDIIGYHEKSRISCYEDIKWETTFWDGEDYFDNYFIKLTKLIGKKIEITSDTEMIALTWFLLRKAAMCYFHKWIGENTSIRPGRDLAFYKGELDTLHFVEYDEEQLEMWLMCFLIEEGVISIYDFYQSLGDLILNSSTSFAQNEKEVDEFERFLFETNKDDESNNNFATLDEIDKMSGLEFENLLEQLFLSLGYRVKKTKQSGDQGVDLILTKANQVIGVQSKRSANSIGNKAVQEISAGLQHYGLKKGMVVTNNFFTPAAISLAQSNSIVLWDRDILKQQLNLLNM